MKRTYAFALLSIVGVSVGLLSTQARAVTAPQNNTGTGQALEIAPPVVNLSANPGQTLRPEISLRNISNGKLVVNGSVNDFTAAGEDGIPKIMLDEQTAESPYSIKPWVSPLARQIMDPRKIIKLPVTIRVPANAAPGGYYGVIRFTATPPELESTGVSLSASLGALVLIRVNGAAQEKMEIEEFAVQQNNKKGTFFESAPVTFVQRLKNTGNVHLQPTGQVIVKDMFGKTVGATNVNLPPRNILPASIRKFEQQFDKSVLGNKILFGRYDASLTMTYGDGKQVVKDKISFWVIPYKLIGMAIIGLIGAFFILRFLIQRYNRSIIQKSQKSRRK